MLLKVEHCKSCVGASWPDKGFVPASGTGDNGVLIVGESAGESESFEGVPLTGKPGYFLFQQLSRIGVEREGFRIHNVLSCRPPLGRLFKTPYEEPAINHCAPLLDQTIAEMQERCKSNGKTFVILTLGPTAFKRILGLTPKSPILGVDYLCYPFWSDRYKAWVIAADAPSHLMKGNTHLLPILHFAFKRALEIAEEGLTLDRPDYLLDPNPHSFKVWAEGYFAELERNPEETFLSYDIETPYKVAKAEDELAKDEADGDDYRILRISFAYKPNQAVSVVWNASFLPVIERLFASRGVKVGWNSANYDDPRILAQVKILGDRMDAMLCWHVLNSSLKKGLGFVTPFYVQTTPLWKHLSEDQPAFYNAKDADMALRNFIGIRRDLIKNSQWDTLDRHVIKLNQALNYMSGVGVKLDTEMRSGAEIKLQGLLDEVEGKMEEAVPQEARKLKVYKKAPKDTSKMVQVQGEAEVRVCPKCGVAATAAHFKSVGKKKLKSGLEENPCVGLKAEKRRIITSLWAAPQEFKVSKLGLTNYQKALRHQAIINRKEQKVTFDEKAILKLVKKYPKDPLYPRILEHRGLQKLLSTYIGVTTTDGRIRGGLPIGLDGRVHTLYTHNPSTLRLASQNPNLQNLPRPKGPDDLSSIIRNLFVAGDGCTFLARDYSGIEAVLVGYFALAPRYIRLAKIDVHSFYTAYALHELDGRISGNDLPLLSWDDDKLRGRLSEIKKEFKHDRNSLYKHLIHGANFKQGPKGAQEKIFLETGIEYPVNLIAKVMGIYFELFPEIPKWHTSVLLQAEKDGYIRNPFGYVHRFNKVFDYEKVGGQWEKKPGPDTNKVIAFGPQSTAAGIIKEALLRLYFERFYEAGIYLRLQIHDEIFCEVPKELIEVVDAIMREEMERPIEALAMPESWGMGPYLSIDTEAKMGNRWGGMH